MSESIVHITVKDPKLANDPEVQKYLGELERILEAKVKEIMVDVMTHGTAVLDMDKADD